jgi:uncharacterized repeat protein (TIGR02543 family)
LQKLTAFLTAIAIIAGFLPLSAVKVSANVNTVDCEVVVENEDNNNYTSQVAVQYMANPEANPNDDASWTDIAPNAGTSVYSFPVTAKDGDDIHVRFILSKAAGENDPRVITGFKATVGDKQIIPVVDERLSDDLCTLTVPFDTTAGVSKVAIRVSLPNNLEFTQTNESNKDFYQFLLNRNLGSLTIPSDKTLEIFGASVIITGNLVLQENAKLRIQNNKEGEQIISTGTLTAGSIVGANNATIMLESKANIPSGFTFYRWGESGPEEVDPSDIPDDMCWFELYYDAQESKWFLNEFDPFSFSVVVDDNSNLVGASLVYKAEYSLNGGTDWTEANFAENLPNNFSGLKNISGGTVTFDSANRDLKELFFRLPDDVSTWVESPEGSGNWIEVYPNVMFRITIMNADEFETTAVTIGGGDDKINLTSVTESGNIIFTSSALNTDVIPHDIRLTLDSGFNADDSYGAAFEIPCDNGWSISNEGKTVVFDCFDGNTISVTSTGNVVVERKDQQNGPTIFIVWSDKTDFSVTAANAPGYTAYHEKENDRLVMDENYKIDVTVTAKGYDNTVLTRVNFEMANLKIEGYDSISPNPDYWENNNPDKDYTLTSGTYTVTFPHGTVTVELVDSDPTDNVNPKWSGYKETWHDDFDNTDHEAFKIETTAQVKLTFMPAEGYQIISNLELSGGDPEASNVALNLDTNNSCVISLGTEKNQLNDPFVQIGGPDPTGTPDPQGGNKVTFTGATGMTDTDTDDGIVVINYEHGSVTFTQGDGTMKDGDIFNPVWDSETKTVTIEFNLEPSFTIAADPNYDSTCKINNDEQEYQETYSFAPSPNTNVDITFMGPTFVLEVGGELKEGTTYEVDDSGTKITLTYDHGKVEITNFASLVDVIPVTPGGSSVVISYEFTLEGNKADVKFIPDEDYIFSGMHLDGKEVAPDDERINNCVLSLTGIDKNNKVSVEPRFDLTPELKIVKVNAGETIGYDSSTKTLTFSENGINKGTVTITNESDPFSGNPQQDSKITSDITFTITPGTVPESNPEIKYVCFVMLNNGQGIYFPEAGTYTLKASDLRSTPEGNKNELSFEFKTLAADQLAKVKFNGEIKYDSGTQDYYIEYKDGENLIGTVVIPGSAVSNFSANNGETTVTIKQSVAYLSLTFAPEAGYTPSLTEYGPEYGENQTVTGEWTRDLSITNNNGEYSYSLTVDPQSFEPIGLRVAFSNTKFLQSTVTYKTYEGEQCAVEIGGTGVPGGDLNNKLVEYQTPLSLTADEDSKEYVKVEDGKAYVRMQFSVPFTYYMSEVKVNGVDYSADLPAGYDELIAAFGNQYTNAVIWVEIADSYVIETKAYKAVFDEDSTKTTLAVGNFLWFYDESHKDNDDYVKNAYLEIVQVVYKDQVYTKDNIVSGSAISWDVIEKDGEIVGGEATLPAGSYVTMKLIPDYGTQLVSLGLNGGGFTAHQNEIYTYSFYVGPGNFHLNADFEPVDDVVEASATAVDGGSIALGDGTVDNGTAVLYVGDANVAGAEKTNFENLAADEALEISSYLDISLDKVVYQGVSADEVKYDGDGKNVWTSGLNDLAKPATVTLTLTDDIGDGTVKVLHNHNGNLEVIDADYNPATKELTFETSSFSNYAIAVEAEQYKVTFNANGHGTAPAAQTVTSGSKATKPTDPTASGYTFGGWYTDSACTKAYSFDTAVTANITLYAKWTAVTTPAPSTPAPTNTTTPTPTPEPEIVPSAELIPSGTAHVQDVGNVPVSVDPETGIMTIGTTGQGKRLEEITIDFENTTGLSGTMEYRVHVQDKGWLPWTEAGNPAGTEGESKRIEAIEIRLTGELAEYYSVEYCVHIQDYGDMQGWVADGALAGTTGESKRIEEIKVRIVPKGSGDSMSVKYRVHIEDFGWEGSYASGGAMSGTSGQSKRLEAIEIFLTGVQYSGGIKYKTHVQDIGWESSYAQNGEMSGTQGQAKRLEGISIELYGEVAEYYDIYYRVHAQDIGWMGWAKNGEYAGTAGRSARLEGIQIVLVPKGGAAPGATYNGITAATDQAFIEGF